MYYVYIYIYRDYRERGRPQTTLAFIKFYMYIMYNYSAMCIRSVL